MTGGMILKRTPLTALTSFAVRRKFNTRGCKLLVCLLLAPLLCVSCARPGATAIDRTSPLVYAAVGDSTGVGLGARDGGGYVERLFARIKQKRPDSTLINLSAAGATTTDAINKQVARLDTTRATLVTICVGTNDLLRGGSDAKQFAENYETLVAKLKQPGRLIIVANLPDVAAAPAAKGMVDETLTSRLEQFNRSIEATAKRHGLPLVDLYKLSGETARSHPEFFSTDGLHPSDLGYAHWAEAMWAVVEQSISE
ncbi:MAG TPA: SGNH/GDSL hydrolase family protein [Pyrinomonadaceae bacterium]|nr:SGNH/GDSL hydrolase family protein [Pyrinomonadaceae bacterium]